MSTEPEKPQGVDSTRIIDALDVCSKALINLSAEERRRVLTALDVLFQEHDDD